jgi:hypothetical protein
MHGAPIQGFWINKTLYTFNSYVRSKICVYLGTILWVDLMQSLPTKTEVVGSDVVIARKPEG